MGVKTERNKQQKRDALLNTAFHLFSTKGMQKTSISDIVEEAGVAKGTFYLYFQDKSDIRNKLISHKASQLFQSAYAAMKATGITSFEEQIIYMVDFYSGQAQQRHHADDLHLQAFKLGCLQKCTDRCRERRALHFFPLCKNAGRIRSCIQRTGDHDLSDYRACQQRQLQLHPV